MRIAGYFAVALVTAGIGLAQPKGELPTPTDEITLRLEAITSRATRTQSVAPKFAFTGNLLLDPPATSTEAVFGLADTSLADRKRTTVVLAGDTAWITTYLGEYSQCAKAGCDKGIPDSWSRATALFEKADNAWQPVAWAITPSIHANHQQETLDDGIVPDAIKRDVKGAEAAAKVFESTAGDPKKFAATFSDRAETILLGSELGERYVGPKAKTTIGSWSFSFKVRDGVRAGISKSGNVAWVAANVDGASTKRPKAKALPFRVFALYEKTGADWKIVAIQFSTAV